MPYAIVCSHIRLISSSQFKNSYLTNETRQKFKKWRYLSNKMNKCDEVEMDEIYIKIIINLCISKDKTGDDERLWMTPFLSLMVFLLALHNLWNYFLTLHNAETGDIKTE